MALPRDAAADDLRQSENNFRIVMEIGSSATETKVGQLNTGVSRSLAIAVDLDSRSIRDPELPIRGRLPERAELCVPTPTTRFQIKQRLDISQHRLRLEDVGRVQAILVVNRTQSRAQAESWGYVQTQARTCARHDDFR